MRVLFITTPGEDYVQDSLLYGLRRLLGPDLVDWPRKAVMYADEPRSARELYGRGFTMWKLLPDLPLERPDASALPARVAEFDRVVFGSVRRQSEVFRRWFTRPFRCRLPGAPRVAFLDGEDHRNFFPPALARGTYFKRERTAATAALTRPISIAIPGEKIAPQVPAGKDRLFATHIQCEEAYRLGWIRKHCAQSYAFDDEEAYRADLQRSYFGVTMRKSGWDCMRHYEIAANGTVPCFWQLGAKSRFGAPFELIDGKNCVVFDTAEELERKTQSLLDHGRYGAVAENALAWARQHSCEAAARYLLSAF
jgi:hypothetical protein